MEQISQFWHNLGEFQILENNLHDIAICGLIMLFGILLKRVFSILFTRLIYRLFKKASDNLPAIEFVNLLKGPVEFFFFIILIYSAFNFLHYPENWRLVSDARFGLKMIISRAYGVFTFISIVWIIFRSIDFFALVLGNRAIEDQNKLQKQLVPFLKQVVKLSVSIVFFFIILGVVFQLNVGAIVAGLGLGGVVVALAGKETLENLLASFSIFIDQPFVTGDLIKVGNITGNVEAVGFRTSRIRTLEKSIVTIPNKELVSQAVENLSFRDIHKDKFNISLPYKTSAEILKTVTEKIKEEIMLSPLTNTKVPLVYFDGFGAYSLEITIIFYAKAVDFEDFWQIKEALNYRIIKIIADHDICLEYPSSNVHLKMEA
jgi:MscS family membrane protein